MSILLNLCHLSFSIMSVFSFLHCFYLSISSSNHLNPSIISSLHHLCHIPPFYHILYFFLHPSILLSLLLNSSSILLMPPYLLPSLFSFIHPSLPLSITRFLSCSSSLHPSFASFQQVFISSSSPLHSCMSLQTYLYR